MTIVYLASFIGGLLLAVRIMMYGVERPRDEHPAGERSFRLSPPIVVAVRDRFRVDRLHPHATQARQCR